MNQFLTGNTVRLAGAVTIPPARVAAAPAAPALGAAARVDLSKLVLNRDLLVATQVTVAPPQPPSLPMLSTRTGSLFADRNDANLHWYLADYALADDVDAGFAFAAKQSGQDAQGNPFYTAQISLTLRKSRPGDANDFAKANPTARLEEIPLADLSATLVSSYTDDSGQAKQRNVTGTVKDNGDGSLTLSFAPILGSSVLGLYQDLTVFGKAQIQLAASYAAWSRVGAPVFLPRFLPVRTGPASPEPLAAIAAPAPLRSFVPVAVQNFRFGGVAPPVSFVQTQQTWQAQIALGLKYRQDGYQLKFTVSTDAIPNRVIRDADDLREFDSGGSEYRELRALGDISQRYPSLRRAYVGSFSHTIVVVPARYSIVRGRSGCAAQCLALVDSAASNGSKCKFEFDFTVAPEVSRIEFLQFAQEISQNADLKDFKLKLPEFLQDTPASTLQTAFQSTSQFTAAAEANSFAVSVSVADASAQTPAVANANLLIAQLCSTNGTTLVGSLSLKLDDAYTEPVLAPLVLNFKYTAGADELVPSIDEAAAQIKLTNEMPLGLQLSRYALVSPSAIAVVPGAIALAGGATATIPLPAEHANLAIAADGQLMLPTPMVKADVARFLDFQTADVQETQYVVAIDASGVNFASVLSVSASMTFASLPGVAPQTLALSKNLLSDSRHIVIPLENAVFTLPGTVQLTIAFVDASRAPLQFSVQHDFTEAPVLLLLQNDIDKNTPQ